MLQDPGAGGDGGDGDGDDDGSGGDDKQDDGPREAAAPPTIPSDGMQIFVKSPHWTEAITLNVGAAFTIHIVKALVYHEKGVPMDHQVLRVDGALNALDEDTMTLEECGIVSEAWLSLKIEGRGGAGATKRTRQPSAPPANPFTEEEVHDTIAEDKKLFETAFHDAVRVFAMTSIDSSVEINTYSSPKLADLMVYVNSKARNSDKVAAVGGYGDTAGNFERVASKCKAAAARYRKLVAEDIWKTSVVQDMFDASEFKVIIRQAQLLAKNRDAAAAANANGGSGGGATGLAAGDVVMRGA